MSTLADLIEVEVIEAWPDRVRCVQLRLPADSTVRQALAMPQVREQLGDARARDFGIHGEACDELHRLHHGDRIELYRPLLIDPKAARRERAAEVKRK